LNAVSNSGVIHSETTQNQEFQKVDQGGSGGSTQTFGITTATKISSKISGSEVEMNSQETPENYPDPP